ncbi:DUF3108 domain-containing protein [Amycolatopsis nigrescens]|uniref:DUF3108 domain-containing protein n=1 Tax=Amycolatopsis nigrescens TaxID=381445 RepID=UPI0003657CF3|nr:DUF3108 domain-containing protein [Amycolatopsis nigrescens]
MNQPFRDPMIPAGEKAAYRASLGADENYDVVVSVELEGDTRYRQLIEARLGELELVVEQAFARKNGMVLAESYRAESRHDGELVTREEAYFRDTKHLQFGGAVKSFPADVTPLLGASIALRGLDFSRGARRQVNLWLAFSVFWQVDLKVERRERVRLPIGSMEAWRVRARPSFAQINGLLDRVIGGLLPPFTLHFDVEPPHRLLRFTFPTGPFPWDPRGLIELTAAE